MMKKLTDKDAILCVSIEEAIAIKNKIGSLLTKGKIKNLIEENGRIVMYQNKRWDFEKDVDEIYKITKASKILNKGVSKKELLRRIEKLEKVMIDNTEVKLVSQANPEEKSFEWTKMSKNITYKEKPELNREDVPDPPPAVPISKKLEIEGIKNELTELPEKWCIKTDRQEVVDYCDKNGAIPPYVMDSNMYAHFPSFRMTTTTNLVRKGYTEINFEQFKKWVLKEDDKRTEALKDSRENTAKAINRAMEDLEEEKPLSIREVQVKVNSQEEANECAEIAKACGQKVDFYCLSVVNKHCYFRQPNITNANFFAVYSKDFELKQISIQEFRERFGKPKEIDLPKEFFEPVLALINSVDNLGTSSWYEVVYYGNEWYSYSGSKTFENGEKVLSWEYCNKLLPNNI